MSGGSMLQAARLIAELGDRLGMSDLDLDGDGLTQIALDGVDVQIEYAGDGHRLILTAPIANPEHDLAQHYGRMLDAGFYGMGTGDAAVVRDPKTHILLLQRQLALSAVDAAELEASLGSFVNAAEALMVEFAADTTDPVAGAMPEASHALLRG